MKCEEPLEKRRIHIRRRRFGAVDEGKHLLVWDFEPMLEFDQFDFRERGQMCVGKAAEHKVHLTNAAMAAAEQKPLAPFVQAVP